MNNPEKETMVIQVPGDAGDQWKGSSGINNDVWLVEWPSKLRIKNSIKHILRHFYYSTTYAKIM